jgi:undecaprenyl-diphosphatase
VPLVAAVLLGIIQGLTEFLPVSSSAHLILARAFFGWETPPQLGLAFDVALHVGTLLAILAFFRADIVAMIRALPTAVSASPPPAGRMVQRIAVGTLPIVVVGALMTDRVEEALRTPVVAASALAVGAVAMLVAERLGPRLRMEQTLGWFDAVFVGCAQAAALVPGMSRSGSTIAMGMFLGIRRDAAARFTFLLAVPATIAAAAKESLELAGMQVTSDLLVVFAIGIVVSGVVGYLTIKYFLRFLAANRLDPFAFYRLALAGLTVVWLWRH